MPLAGGVSTGGLFGDAGRRRAGRGLPLDDRAARRVAPVLEDPALRKVGHDLKFDAIVLARHGVTLRGLETDTMIASYLLDATRSAHPLEELALEHTGYKALREEDVCGRGVKALSFAQLPIAGGAGLRRRACRPGAAARPARCAICCDSEALDGVYDTLEHPLIPVLVAIERAGVRVDVAALAAQAQLVERGARSAGARASTSSRARSSTSTRRRSCRRSSSTSSGSRPRRSSARPRPRRSRPRSRCSRSSALQHELPRLILEWRGLQKLKGTYIDALPQLVNPETGRVHTCFNQAVAATGRLSSSDPNLQNIPIRTEVGREIRRAFVAEPGHVLISADYSQIELRVLAHLSGEQALVEAFARGEDIHDRTAREGLRRR